MPARGVHARIIAGISAVLLVIGLLGLASPATAATTPDPPTGLAPTGSEAVSGIPVLTWDGGPAGTTYDVQVAATAAFSPLLWSTSGTVNHQATPTSQVPGGEVWWRVRSRAAGVTGDWSTATFTRAGVAAPAVTGPADGVELEQPEQPPVLAWEPVAGVTTYTVEISPDVNFTDPARITTSTTKGTSLVLSTLQLPATYYWRVRGLISTGFTTEWSAPRSYRILGLDKPGLVSPADDIDQNVQEVALDWTPVPGAVSYDVQISTDVNFLTLAGSRNGVLGTRWSPPTTLDNDQYYWRVRPLDAAGNKLDWTAVSIWKFRRNWPQQPTLEYPGDGATVGNPFYYQWTPVTLASEYDVQVASSPGMTNAFSCTTTHTTLAPLGTACAPSAAGTYYWRVVARDAPGDVITDAINAQVRRFVYLPGQPVLLAPAPGGAVDVPTLRWGSVALASSYKVSVVSLATGGTVASTTTSATTFTPRTLLDPGSYRWQVQTVDGKGKVGASLLPDDQRRFTVVDAATPTATAAVPVADGGTYDRFPTLRWSPVVGADSYTVWIRRTDTVGWTELPEDFVYPAGDDRGTTYLVPGSYEWYVEAYDASLRIAARAGTGTFSIRELPTPTDYRAAITGNALTGNAGTTTDYCAATLPAECQNLRQTPVLSWASQSQVGLYKLYIARDSEMTNLVPGYSPVLVYDTMWANPKALPDSQAGSAYYWQVVPCVTPTLCAPLQHSDHAFNKLSNQVELLSPANGATVSDDVTLNWRDFLATEQAAGTGDSSLTTRARTEAQSYVVQVDTDPNFQPPLLEEATVDQTTYTAPATTYPEGPIYWRVQAVDGSDNKLAWSTNGSLLKVSPTPQATTPGDGATVPGDVPLRWQPLNFAKSYDVEIYKNDDRIGNSGNLVLSASSQQVVYAPTSPLAAAATPYTWRIRRVDASGRKGGWSTLRPFTVTGPAPVLTSPTEGAEAPPSDALFTWDAEPTASTYRFERRRIGASDITETVTTAATAWAPTKAIAGGSWEWRVTSLDANTKAIGSSAWRTVTVRDTPTATTPVGIAGSGGVGTALTVEPPVWDMPDVVTTYQWLRDGRTITGATDTVYELTPADYPHQVSVRATGTRSGYLAGTSTSAPIATAAGVPLVATAPPTLSGTVLAGQSLTTTTGTWPGAPRYTYQWLRDGEAISGATGASYRLVAGDAGHLVSARVTAVTSGYAPGTATSSTRAVPRIGSTVTATTTTPLVAPGKRAVVAVTITAPLAVATGTVQVTEGKKTLVTKQLATAANGRLTIKLPKLPKGKHALKVRYLGSTGVAPSSSGKVKIKVG